MPVQSASNSVEDYVAEDNKAYGTCVTEQMFAFRYRYVGLICAFARERK